MNSPKIEQQEILNKIFEHFCPQTNVAEYFYVLGIDSDIIFSDLIETIKPYYQNAKVKPCVISQFPPFTRPYSNIDKSILIKHCFPQGFNIIESITPPQTELFHFNLDNLLHLKDVPKLYYTTLLFYEPLSSYLSLSYTYKHESQGNTNTYDYIRTKQKRSQSLTNIKKDLYYLNNKKYPFNTPMIYDHKRNKSYYKYKPHVNIHKQNYNVTYNKHIYIPKAICICSRAPFPKEFKQVLTTYYEYSMCSNIKYPLEKLIEVLTLNIPLPTPGIITYQYNLPNKQSVSFSRTEINKRNIISYNMSSILSFQDKDIMEIFRFLLYECPILFFSKNKELLTNVVNTFLDLLYPFKYQYPNISILPVINFGLIEIEDSFCFGINETYRDNFFDRNNISIVNKVIQIADIDNGVLKLMKNKYENNPMIKIKDLGESTRSDESRLNSLQYNGDLNKSFKQKLSSRLATLRKNMNIKDTYTSTELTKYNDDITDMFFEYNYSLMSDYYKALDQNNCKQIIKKLLYKERPQINELFNIDELDSHGDKALADLTKTKLFYDFIERNYVLNSLSDKIDILFFGDMVTYKKKRNRTKRTTKYFYEDDYFIQQQSITFRLPSYFTEDELYFIQQQPTSNSTMKYFQKVSNTYTTYFIFPKLLYNNSFFPNEITHSSKPLHIDNEFKKHLANEFAKKDYFTKYAPNYAERFQLKAPQIFADGIINEYANLCMLYLFSLVFHYCELNEKHFRFYEILDAMKKTTYVDRSTLSLLFASIVEHGTGFMAIKFYETIQEKGFLTNYCEYAYLCNKFASNFIYKSYMKKFSLSSEKMKVVYFKERNDEYLIYEPTQDNLNAIPKRSFNCGEHDIILFESELKCKMCNRSFEITSYTLMYDKMDILYQMAPCPNCNTQIAPLMTLHLGEDKIKESFIMWNPYYLFTYYVKDLVRDYGTSLDLDVFRMNHSHTFWNCVWYFYFTCSSFDFLLQYKDKHNKHNLKRYERLMLNERNESSSNLNVMISINNKFVIQSKVITVCYISKYESIST